MQQTLTKKFIGTSLLVVLMATGLLTSVAFAQAKGKTHADNNHGRKLGHFYGKGHGGTPPGHNKNDQDGDENGNDD